MNVEIDTGSGFCFGVTTAIRKAEEELATGRPLYCLGDIVHNDQECERLRSLGLHTVGHAQLPALGGATVLLRAHGEPPQTYAQARDNSITLVDATCPVVLNLQRRIKAEYDADTLHTKQIVIYGKNGHAEVVGLVGQTEGTAIVIENLSDAAKLDFTRPISLYSQTTKSLHGFRQIVEYIQRQVRAARPAEGWEADGDGAAPPFRYYDTICRQVANRIPNVRRFAARHDVVVFVCGRKSSNGQILLNECAKVNPRTHLVESPSEIRREWFEAAESVGVCGATSTPKWLMECCRDTILSLV